MEVSDFLSSEFELDISADTLRKSRERIFLAHVGRAIDMLTLRRMSFEELTSNHSRKNDIVDGAMKVFEKVKFGRVYLYPSVAEVLDILRKNYSLAVITNGNSDPDRANLAGVFGHVLLGEKYAFKKPDARIFHTLFDCANIVDPSRVCHVGDSLEDDVRGAK